MTNRYDLDSYLQACVCALRYKTAATTLKAWHARRRDVLAIALRVPHLDESASRWLADHCLCLATRVDHPFSGVLEIPEGTVESFQEELSTLQAAFCTARGASLALARSILVSSDPELATRSVSAQELLHLGFDPNTEPDEMEFL